MKYSALYAVAAGFALSTMLLPETALAEKKTLFTSTETDTGRDFPWFTGASPMPPTEFYMFGGTATFNMTSKESRVAGSGWYSMYAIYDVATRASTLWGEFHIVNSGGKWDGYWTGTEKGFTATMTGSGGYKGLVSKWTSTEHHPMGMDWSGYIVENGPGDVPFKISGSRTEQLAPIFGLPFIKATSFAAGGGQASHIGTFTDVEEIGLMNLALGKASGSGTAKAANGDIFIWVSYGTIVGDTFKMELFFAGGTGRFEHAVGSLNGEVIYPNEDSYEFYTYKAAGTIRY